jgi:RNA polymerase sigma-70 factor (ECF subfamily)
MNPEADDDVGLMRRCLAGDDAAVATFVDRYQGLVFSLCFRMLSHRQDAEDVTQETLLRALRHLDQWEPSRPFKPWLLAIAANRCRTRLGQRARRPRELGDQTDHVAAPVGWSPLSEELQRAVGHLRDDYRLCFVMFYQQELSVQEIAEALNCPEGTVKTWLYRARKQIAAELLDRGVVDRDGYELRGL